MPTYEYKCDACGAAFERFQSIMANPIRRCPECGKSKVRRLISSGAGMIFKGSGFYITDYRDKSYTDQAKSESGSGEKGGEKSGEKSGDKPADAKTEKKSDAKPAETPASSKPESKPAKPDKGDPKSENKPKKKKE